MDNGTNGLDQTFAYDPLNRVVTEQVDGVTTGSYTYDLDGNRTAKLDHGVTTTYAYDRTGQLTEQVIGTTHTAFAYNRTGDMTAAATADSTTTTYAYDSAGHLIGITPPGGSAVSFGVDALGRIRTRGADTYDYVGTSETVWRVSNATLTTTAAIDALGQRTAVKSGTTQGFLVPDLHGNAVVVVDAAETSGLAALRYDAYGQTIDSYDSGGDFNLPWRHQGRLDVSPDPDNPLYEAGARYYQPGAGTFTALDSVGG